LGEEFFADPDNIGYYWGILETRPFMRALEGLATTQWEMGQREEAERNYRELLRLNPGDNQGIRYLLLNLLMEMGRDEQARALLSEYEDDWSAESAYTSALLLFREKGDGPESKQALTRAFEVNQHVPDYLTGKKRIPSQRSDMITMGGEDEAPYYASAHLNHWRKTPGAIDWLRLNYKKRK
jgi:tetratricopeptide (TPR) repeat protein